MVLCASTLPPGVRRDGVALTDGVAFAAADVADDLVGTLLAGVADGGERRGVESGAACDGGGGGGARACDGGGGMLRLLLLLLLAVEATQKGCCGC